MEKTVLASVLATGMGLAVPATHAAMLVPGDLLTIDSGIIQTDANGNYIGVGVGSWFAMDMNSDNNIAGWEKTALAMGTNGIIIGSTTYAGASHSGLPTSGDTNAVTAPWGFFGNTGSDYFTVAPMGGTTTGLDFSGWTVTWNGIAAINMGSGAWGAGFSDGIANFVWSGLPASPYTLDYAATVPIGDASGFGGVKYFLHLEGLYATLDGPIVPVPAAIWLFGSGLLGLLAAARRRRGKQE